MIPCNDNKRMVETGGYGFLGLLALLFITLKLTSVITWSWWLVLLPLYGVLAVSIVFLGLAACVAGTAALIVIFNDTIHNRSTRRKK